MEFERVKNVIVDQLSVDADEVTLEASFVDDLGADSLDVVELIINTLGARHEIFLKKEINFII